MNTMDKATQDVIAAKKLSEDIDELLTISGAEQIVSTVALVNSLAKRVMSPKHLEGLHLALDLTVLNLRLPKAP